MIRAALALAQSASQLMLPVARRRLEKEQRQGGLVVVLALYGEEAAVAQMAGEAPQRWAAAQAAAAARGEQPQAAAEQQPEEQQQQRQQGEPPSTSAAGAQAAAAAEQQREQPPQPPPGGDGSGDVPPAVADVTVAVQYMVESSKVVFHKGEASNNLISWTAVAASADCFTAWLKPRAACSAAAVPAVGPAACASRTAAHLAAPAPAPFRAAGYPKSGLMGFCDPAPGAPKALLVYFTFKVRGGACCTAVPC